MMTKILSADPQIEVIAAASDPFAAARYIKDELPDVVTLDVEMPGWTASPSCAN
jgi:two-component system chemotaxis response regulator CheB